MPKFAQSRVPSRLAAAAVAAAAAAAAAVSGV
jgi:hypothetical protein